MNRLPTFLEFFAGGGMAREGLGTGWRCLFANDFDDAKARAYRARWTDADELTVADVDTLTLEDLPSERADLAWASFPCQDLSLAGLGAGLAGERSGSFLPFWMLMRGLRDLDRSPRVIVLENVCGLLTANGGQDFFDICRMLQLGGYRFGAMVVDASDFLPQSRPRLFIVAVDRGLLFSGEPEPSTHWHPQRLRSAMQGLRYDLRADWLWFNPPMPEKRNSALIDLLERDPRDVPWHSPEETSRLMAMMSLGNAAKVDAARATGRPCVGAIYKRTRHENGIKQQRAEVRFDGIAGCLRTPGGGSSRQTILVVDGANVRSRLLSARETARLMGLPEDYPLPKRYNDAYHLTGDGVAVPVVRFLAEHVIEAALAASRVH